MIASGELGRGRVLSQNCLWDATTAGLTRPYDTFLIFLPEGAGFVSKLSVGCYNCWLNPPLRHIFDFLTRVL